MWNYELVSRERERARNQTRFEKQAYGVYSLNVFGLWCFMMHVRACVHASVCLFVYFVPCAHAPFATFFYSFFLLFLSLRTLLAHFGRVHLTPIVLLLYHFRFSALALFRLCRSAFFLLIWCSLYFLHFCIIIIIFIFLLFLLCVSRFLGAFEVWSVYDVNQNKARARMAHA